LEAGGSCRAGAHVFRAPAGAFAVRAQDLAQGPSPAHSRDGDGAARTRVWRSGRADAHRRARGNPRARGVRRVRGGGCGGAADSAQTAMALGRGVARRVAVVVCLAALGAASPGRNDEAVGALRAARRLSGACERSPRCAGRGRAHGGRRQRVRASRRRHARRADSAPPDRARPPPSPSPPRRRPRAGVRARACAARAAGRHPRAGRRVEREPVGAD
jgi:hypothetical protein